MGRITRDGGESQKGWGRISKGMGTYCISTGMGTSLNRDGDWGLGTGEYLSWNAVHAYLKWGCDSLIRKSHSSMEWGVSQWLARRAA